MLDKPGRSRPLSFLLGAALVLALALQVSRVITGSILPVGQRAWSERSRTALARSAAIFDGDTFADYMVFLREVIPEDAKVILPPHEPVQNMANIGLMEYFLMPRELHNCGIAEVEACILRATGPTSYIVTAWQFPPQGIAEQVKDFVPFRDGLGVYVPRSAAGE